MAAKIIRVTLSSDHISIPKINEFRYTPTLGKLRICSKQLMPLMHGTKWLVTVANAWSVATVLETIKKYWKF